MCHETDDPVNRSVSLPDLYRASVDVTAKSDQQAQPAPVHKQSQWCTMHGLKYTNDTTETSQNC